MTAGLVFLSAYATATRRRGQGALTRGRQARRTLWQAYGRARARAVRGWPKTRAAVLSIAGLAFFVVAAFSWCSIAGWVTAGVACFVLEWLSRD